ncbi:OmpP1/FadL family transporter [Lutibacter citreus]|uniref:OmpP1/FadL family transporter n=1 Tax=Lutibacter citreus TaxID=2138210 RepID=UPI000DBE78BA|nr:outer membrane protein transport protein [Lutibacter citreus]
MKNIILSAVVFCIALISNAQTLGYNDLGVLFSNESINGTARYNAMSGAFGALGGDLSAIETNPAGAAVFMNSEFSLTFAADNIETSANFYGNNILTENDNSNITQAGGVFVFSTNNRSNWGKVAISFNYSNINDYENNWFANGNSGFAPVTDLYDTEPIVYINSENQTFENFTDGETKKYSFTIASEYNNNLYLGASINTYDLEYFQRTIINEYNNDGNGNTLDISQAQELFTYGNGISLNFGLISKLNDNMRIGLAFQSPIWYSLSEEFLEYDDNVNEPNNALGLTPGYSGINGFDYNLKTPSKLTGSLAYIFNKQGLVSLDYTYKNYGNTKLTNAEFSNENQNFKTDLESSGELRIGTEWRIENISLRGGYFYQESPYKNAIDSDNVDGFSFGAGLKFRGGKIDLSYQKQSNTLPYNIYGSLSNDVDSAELNIDRSKITATLVLNI